MDTRTIPGGHGQGCRECGMSSAKDASPLLKDDKKDNFEVVIEVMDG